MSKRIALVTGASRGIGAATARLLAAHGDHVLINYREKRTRAEKLAAEIRDTGGSATVVPADITASGDVDLLASDLAADFGRLDVLVLNASGGLELGAEPDYAMRINRDAQLRLVDALSPHMPLGSRIVYVTSHQAHFFPHRPVPAGYEPIAESKRAGEDALRDRAADLADRGVGFSVVSGDMIDGTIIVRLLERRDRDAVAARRAAETLPTVDDFAEAIAAETHVATTVARTLFIGGSDYLIPVTASSAGL